LRFFEFFTIAETGSPCGKNQDRYWKCAKMVVGEEIYRSSWAQQANLLTRLSARKKETRHPIFQASRSQASLVSHQRHPRYHGIPTLKQPRPTNESPKLTGIPDRLRITQTHRWARYPGIPILSSCVRSAYDSIPRNRNLSMIFGQIVVWI
jgi:hypothetical protein